MTLAPDRYDLGKLGQDLRLLTRLDPGIACADWNPGYVAQVNPKRERMREVYAPVRQCKESVIISNGTRGNF